MIITAGLLKRLNALDIPEENSILYNSNNASVLTPENMGFDHKAMGDATGPYKICLTALETNPLKETGSVTAAKSKKATHGSRKDIRGMERRIFSTNPQKKT